MKTLKVLEIWSEVEEITVMLSNQTGDLLIRSQAKPCPQHCLSSFKAVNYWVVGLFTKPKWI